jgi:hypothetical protein
LTVEQNSEEGRNNRKEILKQDLVTDFGIFCCSSISSNKHNWEQFSDNFSGFCIELDLDLILLHCRQNNLNIYGRSINYYRSIPKLRLFHEDDSKKMDELLDVIFSLPSKHQIETEYRLARVNYPGLYLPIQKFPSTIIKSVIYGHNISPEDLETLRNILARPEFNNVILQTTLIQSEDYVSTHLSF